FFARPGLTAQLNRLRKTGSRAGSVTSAAKAAIDFAALTARLKPRPFKNKVKTRVFLQPVKSCPSQIACVNHSVSAACAGLRPAGQPGASVPTWAFPGYDFFLRE